MPASTTTTTTTTTTSSQVNQQLTVGTTTSSYNLGNYVTDVSVQPYMAPTVISFSAYNMRPNTTLHVFFDSINVDQYCCPGVLNTSGTVDSASSNYILQNGSYGSPVKTDNNGNVFGIFNVPDSTFKTGTLTLEICDVTSIILGNNAITTSAFSSFNASNITLTKSSSTLTTINPVISVANVVNSTVTVNSVSNTVTIPDNVSKTSGSTVVNLITNFDPIAQLFQFSTPNGEVGGFVTSLDLFFFQASLTNANNGVTVYISETLNGYPDTSNILPFSVTHISGSSLNVSNNASIATNIKFESPVYLDSDTYYAFIVKPDQSDPDIDVWIANLGDIDVTTGAQVYSAPNLGVLYEGATTSGWTALQSQYLKFNLYRANFTTSYANATFNNTNRDHLSIYNVTYANTSYSIIPGDIVYASTNSTVSTVNTSANATAFYYNVANGIFDITYSSGNFTNTSFIQVHRFANTTINNPNANTLIASAAVANVVDVRMNTCVPRMTSIAPAGTQIRWSTVSTSNAYTIDSSAFPVNIDASNELFDYERLIVSSSNEKTYMNSNKSLTLNAFLASDTPYLSPLIDTIREDVYAIQNLIDPLSTLLYNEMFNYGTAQTKYLSLPVTLATGQQSENFQVIIDAYKPYSSYIKVYAKFLNNEDSDTLSNKTWTPLNCDGDDYYSNYGDTSDYITLNYTVPSSFSAFQANGTITISNTSSTIIGNNTSFTTDLLVGSYINVIGDNSQKILSIANNTSLTLTNNFSFNWSSNNYFIVPPPTTAWLSGNTNVQITGTVASNTTSNIITGTGTNFLSVFSPGSIISLANDEQVVVSVTNNTNLSVGTSWSSNNTSTNASILTLTGINYLNANNNLYMNYNQFQIKMVLLSDDDSKVPICKSLSAISTV